MKTELTIGRVLRPRGIKGVVKIEAYSDNTSRLLHLKTLTVGGVKREIGSLSAEGAFLYANSQASTRPKMPKV